VSHFFHAVGVFFHHLAAVRWEFIAFALLCNLARLFVRGMAWRAILAAAYPEERPRLRSVFGAYMVGVGVNAVVPARAGDFIKLYLVRHRIPGSTYTTLAPTLVVETLFDAVVGAALLAWALAIGVLPTHEIYSRLPSVDWRLFFRHEQASLIALIVVGFVVLIAVVYARHTWGDFRARVGRGFAILADRPRFVRRVIVPQTLSWVFRVATVYFCLLAFQVPASIHNALLVQVVDSLSTLFPATPGGAGTKQGLTEYLFRGRGVPSALLLAFSVGMNIALLVANVLSALVAMALMARTLSFRRLLRASRAEREHAVQR
jgi:uncharacterized membrane protein YbhN (UPF0104 family)